MSLFFDIVMIPFLLWFLVARWFKMKSALIWHASERLKVTLYLIVGFICGWKDVLSTY